MLETLVLADGGICCIDGIRHHQHGGKEQPFTEAFRQQTVSFAKGSIVATLQTRCSVFGATNPMGMKIDPNESLSHNTGLAPPLLSRFDCVFILQVTRTKTGWCLGSYTCFILCGESIIVFCL